MNKFVEQIDILLKLLGWKRRAREINLPRFQEMDCGESNQTVFSTRKRAYNTEINEYQQRTQKKARERLNPEKSLNQGFEVEAAVQPHQQQ